jgi:hypothetical protein
MDHQPPETASGPDPLMGFSYSDRHDIGGETIAVHGCLARRFPGVTKDDRDHDDSLRPFSVLRG